MKIFHVGSHQFRESLRELLRELWFSYCSSRGMPFREWNFVFREMNFEFRELLREYPGTLPELREYPGTLPELREWPFHFESVFPEIGVVPRLLNKERTLSFLSLSFWISLFFSPCEDVRVFSSIFPFFSRDFRGSVGIKKSLFFWWFSLPFS